MSVNKYYNPEKAFTFAQKTTEEDVVHGKELSDKDIENLCSGFFVNLIYASVVEGHKDFEQGREKALNIAAKVIVKHGRKIKDQLDQNDEESIDSERSIGDQNQPNTSKDVRKISGGTVAKTIKKIAEMISSMSKEEQSSAADNFSAVFEVLDKSFDKLNQTMKQLALEPAVVANIKNILEGTKGQDIFDNLIEKHLSPAEQSAIKNVSAEELNTYKKIIVRQQENQAGMVLA